MAVTFVAPLPPASCLMFGWGIFTVQH
jgi:hypothetical protein